VGAPIPPPSESDAPAEKDERSILPLVAVLSVFLGVGAAALTYGAFFARAKKNNKENDDPCAPLKQEYDASQAAYDLAVKNTTLQELLIEQLKKEIENAEKKLKEKVKEYAADVTQEIMEEVVPQETHETINKAVALADEAKANYDDLVEKHRLAKELLEILKEKERGLESDVREKEAALNVCQQSASLAKSATAEEVITIETPSGTRLMRGTIIENSLNDTSIFEKLRITRTWSEGEWVLHDVEATESDALSIQSLLRDGPWYAHFWEPGSDNMLVIFKDKIFRTVHSDKNTWKDALAHGRSLGIPDAQLDFPVAG